MGNPEALQVRCATQLTTGFTPDGTRTARTIANEADVRTSLMYYRLGFLSFLILLDIFSKNYIYFADAQNLNYE